MLAVKAGAQSSALTIPDSLYAVGNYSGAPKHIEKLKPRPERLYLKSATAQQANDDPASTLGNDVIFLEKVPGQVLSTIGYNKLLQKTC